MTLARRSVIVACLIATLLAAACASADVRKRQSRLETQSIARPERVFVHDFASKLSGIPDGSAISALNAQRKTPLTPQEIKLGRQLGKSIAKHLVVELRKRGIPAFAAGASPRPRTGDAVIRGEFVTVDDGDRLQRVLIGFGAGAVELRTLAEIYVVVSDVLVPLRSAEIVAEGGKMPGMVVSLGIGSIADIAVSGASAIVSETGDESVDGAARRTAAQIAQLVLAGYARRGWL